MAWQALGLAAIISLSCRKTNLSCRTCCGILCNKPPIPRHKFVVRDLTCKGQNKVLKISLTHFYLIFLVLLYILK